MGRLKFMTLNVRSVRSPHKWASLTAYVRNHDPDIFFIQEVNTSEEVLPSLRSYDFFFNGPQDRCNGTAIGIRKSLNARAISTNIIFPGFIQCVTIQLSSSLSHQDDLYYLALIAFYGPLDQPTALTATKSLEDFLELIMASSRGEKTCVVMGGDFNVTLNPSKDRWNRIERLSRFANELRRLSEAFDLVDAWDFQNSSSLGYTFITNEANQAGSRLDRFYISGKFTTKLRRVSVHLSFSDHKAVFLDLNITTNYVRRPYWRFDNSLLQDEDFILYTRELLTAFEFTQTSLQEDPITAWEIMKDELQRHCARYKKIKNLAKRQHSPLDFCVKEAEAIVTRMGWEKLLVDDAQATHQLAQWASRCMPKPLTQLKIGERIVENISELSDIILRHFRRIYEKTTDHPPFNRDILPQLNKLDENEALFLDSPLSENEFTEALKNQNRGKAPGIDGLTVEFYLAFWKELKTLFTQMAQESFRRGRLPCTTSTSVIALLPKTQNPDTIDNWRPISLSNVDYKIIAKSLSRRLSTVISTLVSQEQSYCIPGRTIFDNIMLIRDLIKEKNLRDDSMAIMSLDQSKAFDYIHREYLFNVLKEMGVGDAFINYLITLYNGARGLVRVCNVLITPIFFERGIRQGCPLSGQLFALASEPLLALLRNRISGVSISNMTINPLTASAYADDINIFVDREEDFPEILAAFDTYAKLSGAKLNPQKSVGLWVGKWRGRNDKPLGFSWTDKSLKVLGVVLHNNNDEGDTMNNEALAKKLEDTIVKWKPRIGSMSYRGRVLAINQFIAPKMWHILQVYTPPRPILRKLQAQLVNFVWNGGKHWVSAKVLCAPIESGGLALVDVENKILSFRFRVAQRFLSSDSHPWKDLAKARLGESISWQSHKELLMRRGKNTMGLDAFYTSVIQAWHLLDPRPNGDARDGRQQTNLGFQVDMKSIRKSIVLPINKRMIYPECLLRSKGTSWPLSGKYSEEKIQWLSFREKITFGKDADVSWRLAHGALADAVFLKKTKVRDNNHCPWCPEVIGDIWHLMFDCPQTVPVWKLVVNAVKKLTGRHSVLRIELYAGLIPENPTPFNCLPARIARIATSLSNHIISCAKSVIYSEFTLHFKGARNTINYAEAFKEKMTRRLERERMYHLTDNSIKAFARKWGYKNFFLANDLGEINFQCEILKSND
jgi:exonuclease III